MTDGTIQEFSSVIYMAVISFQFISSIRQTWWLCGWLCTVNLRTNQNFIFSNNSLVGH